MPPQREPVHLARARLRAQQERRAELRRDRAPGQHVAHVGAGHQAAGGDDRHRRPDFTDLGHQRGEPERLVVVVDVRAAVTAGLGALGDDGIGAAVDGDRRLSGIRDRHPHPDARGVQPLDAASVGTAERERHHRRTPLDDHVELGVVVVVVEPRLAEGDPRRLGQRRQRCGVVGDRLG